MITKDIFVPITLIFTRNLRYFYRDGYTLDGRFSEEGRCMLLFEALHLSIQWKTLLKNSPRRIP